MITEDVARRQTWPSTDCNGIPLIDPVSVTVQGNVVLFARKAGAPVDFLYYNVRPIGVEPGAAGEWTGWRQLSMAEPSQRTTPGTPSADAQPMLRLGGCSLITVGTDVTIPVPGDAPFRVVADDRYVSCFRPSDTGTLYVDRFVLVQDPLDGREERDDEAPVYVLERAWETRYRRSQTRDLPAGAGDARGSMNMLDEPFREPTVELPVPGVTADGFDIALVPTGTSGMRWHIAVITGRTITCWSFPQDSTGRVDVSPWSARSFTITPTVPVAGDIEALTPFAGIALSCYEEQERTTMPDGTSGSLRRSIRLAMAVPVRNTDIGLPGALAVFDFAIQPGGTIPELPPGTACVLLDGTMRDKTFTPVVNPYGYGIPADAVHTVDATTISAVLLGQAAAAGAPALLNSADGLLHCYFAGPPGSTKTGPFLVAQMDPIVTRATAAVPWITASGIAGDLRFVARQPGSTLNGLTVRVDSCAGQSDLCTVSVDYGKTAGLPTETWRGVPRDLVRMSAILNGGSSGDPADPAVRSGKTPFYDQTGTVTMARLGTVNGAGPLTLVSHRGDMRLAQVTVTAAPDPKRSNLVLSYALPSGAQVTQTWPLVPTAVTDLVAVLDGDAATYPYRRPESDTPIYALATALGSILLIAKPATSAKLTVQKATDGLAAHCDIVVEPTGSPVITLPNIGRDQAAVVKALRGSGDVMALFDHVSPDACAGAVFDQSTVDPTDLQSGSTLFDVARPVPDGGKLAPGSAAATALQGRSFDTIPPPGADTGHGMLGATAARPTVPLLGEQAVVGDATSALTTSGDNGRWIAAHMPDALALEEHSAVSIPAPSARLAPVRGTTIEAWTRPQDGDPARVVSYNNGPVKNLGGITPSFFLGTDGMPTLRFGSFKPKGTYAGRYVNVPAQPFLAPAANAGFTWEAWIRPDKAAGPGKDSRFGCVFQVQDQLFPAIAQGQLYLDAKRVLTFGYRTGSPVTESTVAARLPLPAEKWTHVAVTGARTGAAPLQGMIQYALTLYVNGEAVAADDAAWLYPAEGAGAPVACLGASDVKNVSMFGSITEMRYWSAARTSAELRRTMNTSLRGTEPGLVGYWPLGENPATATKFVNRAVRYGKALDGTMAGSGQPVTAFSAGEFVNVVAGVGGAEPLVARSFLRADHWHHLAVVYETTGGLRMNPDGLDGRRDYGRCDAAGTEFGEHATVEAWVQVPKPTGLNQTVLAQWGASQSDQAFRFGVTGKGTVFCLVTVQDVTFGTTSALRAEHTTMVCDGKPHHITAVFNSRKATGVGGVTCTLTVYVDGVPAPQTKADFPLSMEMMAVTSSRPLTLGVSTVPARPTASVALEVQEPFQGLLTGVRLSSVAFTDAQVLAAMSANRDYDGGEATVSAWWFDEQTGTFAADSVSDNDFALSDTDMWAEFASISTTNFYCDGVPVGLVAPASAEASAGYQGATQCTIGAYLDNSVVSQGFDGQLAEIRVWQAARTQDQVLDTMYRPLTGSEPNLSAYWPLDGNYADLTSLGSTGTPVGAPAFVPSAAPVANEGPQVRNVYAGPVTEFQESVTGRPSVIEYADSDIGPDGSPAAVMRRAYFLYDPALAVFTGYGLGEMLLTYLGQVQTRPSLIGYIEGAPPVPSENLSRPLYASPTGYNAYFDATSVQLAQTDTTSFSFTSSDYRTTFAMTLDAKLGLASTWKVDSQDGVPGGLIERIGKGKLRLSAHNKTALTQAEQHDEAYASGWVRTRTDTLGLRGAWESDEQLNAAVGRRYQPHNTGYALVESLTADLYAMRLRSTGAMVGKMVLPDLAIPPDRNVLVFRIRPEYVKNGTLDGKVGLVNDPHYPGADVERGSYFRPREAYRLADRIAKADADLATYGNQFNAQSLGQRGPFPNSPLNKQPVRQFYDFAGGVPARGIANRYVWTAAGGLHTETESFSATHDNTYAGLYSLNSSAGPAFEYEYDGFAGPYTNIDLLFGGEIKMQVGKKQSDNRGVALNVTNACDPMLLAYRSNGYSDNPCPGKVDAYRFMSFYLPPSIDNYEAFKSTVVDQDWLRFSSDPNAVALRNLRPQTNGAWRVLHRVTYVSRVPPKFDTNPAQTVAPAPELVIDVDDNAFLIKLVEQALGKNPPTAANVGGAVAAVLAPPDGTPSLLGALVPWWAAFVRRTRSAHPDPGDVALLNRLMAATVQYFQAGYAGGMLPIPPV
ncbi:LamG domain-containing protein [Lentzea tibetensis]|uniref:LamG domain-containing protein n=1 Tax=Lentzea tibetensis TaxID=2591470 RepID=A0A563EVM3_9PSEU|nr:LamG domain-containing protein [Lentzea tibetensis]TWP51736.1 LamG domain-containing protein [Lentzea tibetensis]